MPYLRATASSAVRSLEAGAWRSNSKERCATRDVLPVLELTQGDVEPGQSPVRTTGTRNPTTRQSACTRSPYGRQTETTVAACHPGHATAASNRAPAAKRRSSLCAGPISCRLAGKGPPVGTGSDRAGTPARFTGRVQRDTSRSSPSSRWGGKMLSVGVTRRSTSAKTPAQRLRPGTLDSPGGRDRVLVEGAAELQPATHAVADPRRILRHEHGIACRQASTTSRRPACRVASSHPGSARSGSPTPRGRGRCRARR